MRIAFISNCHLVDRYAIREIARHWQVVGIMQPTARSVPAAKKPSRTALLTKVRRVAEQKVYDVYYAHMNRVMGDALYGGEEPGLPVEVTKIPRDLLHKPLGLETMASWYPDVIIVSGAPILKPSLYTLAPQAVNLHLGMSPDYRGEHTLFVPLLRGDYERIGATLHRLDVGVDTGAVLARVFPELEPSDDETTLMVKSLQMIVRALTDFLRASETGRTDHTSGGFPQIRETGLFGTPPAGFNIRYLDRTLRDDVVFHARRALGFGPLPRSPRVEIFY